MADKEDESVDECMSAFMSIVSNIIIVVSMLSEIVTCLIVQQQIQQNIMIGQAAMKGNCFILKAKRKWTLRRRVRSCWKKPGRTEQWWTNLWQGRLLEEEWNVNLRMYMDDFMKLVASPNWSALSCEKSGYHPILFKGYWFTSHDRKFVWCMLLHVLFPRLSMKFVMLFLQSLAQGT